ncbi:MAG: 4'-phosphopantetheinyl transferase superfamily protein [Chloracidobacterium sp.]|uniref:4'-phosphopantetheinyl transferase superfamily protein n=1 Tax=Chloracidobacterium validum TaxID=2821543 RepID=A0ABX8BAL8_9BACT|nr:4'-phosphopantetheinyl transferase superfamily protein [Chloracidobacterium validum]QUW03706.1 4'-phosphopantetheinyl transferase superfamily protein [Chloracidobacterium validum]
MLYLNQTSAKSATPSVIDPSSAQPRLSPEAVHLWWLTLQPLGESTSVSGALHGSSVLSLDERRRAERLRCPRRARRFSLGRAHLRHILAHYLEQAPDAIRFAYTTNGKPYLPDAPQLFFSLAHADDVGLLAIAHGRRVGVDVELPGCAERWLAVARRCLPKAEYRRLWRLPELERPLAMRRCWTRQEAWLKASGEAALRRLLQMDMPLEIPCAATAPRFTIHDTQGRTWLMQDVSRGPACATLVVEWQPDEPIAVLAFGQS